MLMGKPFVKWAGGKRQIVDKLKEYIPEKFNTYYEPFLGGGALLLALSPKKAVINDCNEELINVYRCIKDVAKLRKMCKELDKHEINHSENFYYQIRSLDRDKEKFNKIEDYKRAARFIYLNKACFNGLYSVNTRKEFNQSFGKKLEISTYEGLNLGLICGYLNYNNVEILSVDFENAVKTAKKEDFIYFDPPYDTDTKMFNNYTAKPFRKEGQKRLAEVFKALDKRGCYLMLSNNNTTLINDLYKDFNIHIIETTRNIGGQKKVKELLITNFKNK